jgi:hypothetical protein
MNAFSKSPDFGKRLLSMLILSLTLIIHTADTHTSHAARITPSLSFHALVPLTPGASTTVDIKGRGNIDITAVTCLGAGTLTVGLTKDDTEKDMVSLFIIGINATPSFIPNVAVTPATISASTVMNGFGMVFTLSGVYSGGVPPHEYTLSFKLTP